MCRAARMASCLAMTACLACGEALDPITTPSASKRFTFSTENLATIDFPGASTTRANGINDKGDIVGGYILSGVSHGFLFQDDVFTTMDVPGAAQTVPQDINNRGTVVGYSVDASGAEHGFVFEHGAFAAVDVPGAASTGAFGINNAGDVVGLYIAGGANHGFLLRRGVFSTIDVPGAAYTLALGNNDRGDVVGLFSYGSTGHGFLFRNGEFTTLDFSAASVNTGAIDINDSGDIVGDYAAYPGAPLQNGFLRQGGVYNAIDVPGAAGTTVQAINNRGDLAGWYTTGGSERGYLIKR